jgi:serine/threonine protein kinase
MTGDRRVTQFPGLGDEGEALLECQSNEVDRPIVRTPRAKLKRKFERVVPPARLPLEVNPYSSQWSAKRLSTGFCENMSPWKRYQQLTPCDQAGPAIIAYGKSVDFPIVTIKERRIAESLDLKKLVKVQHDNIVNFIAAFHESSIWLVYECMNISLAQANCCSYGPLKEFEMAAICKEVCLTRALPITNIARFSKGYSTFKGNCVSSTPSSIPIRFSSVPTVMSRLVRKHLHLMSVNLHSFISQHW